MSKRKRFLYIICTVLLIWLVSYAWFTACNLPELPDVHVEEVESELPSTGGDSP